MITGFSFNGKHSYNDFNLIVESKSIQPPAKKKVKESIPGMNGYYDFSTVVSGGEPVYDTRAIPVKIFFQESSRERLYTLYSKVLEWLLNARQSQLVFDFDSGYYYLAEVEEAPSFEEFIMVGELDIKFIAEPYKYGVDNYGSLLWDNIDFDLPDYIEDTSFTISGSKTVSIYVPGSHSIVPDVKSDSNMSCTLNNYTAIFTPSKTTDWGFVLKPGLNSISVTGTGNIDFQFRKETL